MASANRIRSAFSTDEAVCCTGLHDTLLIDRAARVSIRARASKWRLKPIHAESSEVVVSMVSFSTVWGEKKRCSERQE